MRQFIPIFTKTAFFNFRIIR